MSAHTVHGLPASIAAEKAILGAILLNNGHYQEAAGRSDVLAEFHIDDALLTELRTATATGEKYLRWMETRVKATNGELIAIVRKQIYLRRKIREAE